MSDDDGRSHSSGSGRTDADGSDGSGGADGDDGTATGPSGGPTDPGDDEPAGGPTDPGNDESADPPDDGSPAGPTGLSDDGSATGPSGVREREAVGEQWDRSDGPRDLFDRIVSAERGPLMVVREVGVSVVTVALVGLLLFALSGVWPPMVAVESGSMEPHMHRGDLVFVSEPGRYLPDGGERDRGVVTRTEGERVDYRSFGGYGSVVVYDSPGRGGPPVIHRAHFWVNEGENWYDEANPEYHDAEDCAELRNCPAPHAGFITKGDANSGYDQVLGISSPVRPDWVIGVAQVRVPYLGYVRLWLAEGSAAPLVAGPGDARAAGFGSVGASARSGIGAPKVDGNRRAGASRSHG